MNKEQIEAQAKEIMETFAKALEKVEKKSKEVFHVERTITERVEGEGRLCEGFKERMLANAPRKNDDCIIAEKGAWK